MKKSDKIKQIIEDCCHKWIYRKNVSPCNFEEYKKDILSYGVEKIEELYKINLC